MCFNNRQIFGYVCKDERDIFIYCCKYCELEFSSGYELEKHTPEHQLQAMEESISFENDQRHENSPDEKDDSTTTKSKNSSCNAQTQKLPQSSIQKDFRCIVCSTKFNKKSNLVRHMLVHTENRPTDECTICGKQVLDLKVHMKRHTNQMPYQCNICPASFRKRISMQEHVRKHNDCTKKLICSFCETVVFSSQDFTRHIAKCSERMSEDIQKKND